MIRSTSTAAVAGLAICLAGVAAAQQPTVTPQTIAKDVGWTQHLGAQAPLTAMFRDETGKLAPLSTYFHRGPVILMMPFYRCPGVCTLELDVLTKTLQSRLLGFTPGKEFQVVVLSIDPQEGANLAAAKKAEYVGLYGKPQTANGWHFLTGSYDQILRLTNAVGFHYMYDAKTDQIAHPAGMVVLTPSGKVSQYFMFKSGIFPPHDLRLALVQASSEKIGSLADTVLLYCCSFDSATGKYGFAVQKLLRIGGVATIAGVAGFVAMAIWTDRKHHHPHAQGDDPASGDEPPV